MINDIERATSAMLHLDPSMAESDWWRVAAAARAAGVEFDDFDRWSSAGQNYKNTQDCRATWNAHPPKPSGIDAGTLFAMAKRSGWKPPKYPKAPGGQAAPVPRPQAPAPQPEPSPEARAIWERATPLALEHPYCRAKKLTDPAAIAGMRVLAENDSLVLDGIAMAGAAVVPLYRPGAGEVQAVQCIATDGRKRTKGKMADAHFTVGAIEPGQPAYIVEGVGTAWAVWEATGCAALVTCGVGRTATVAAAVKAHHPDVHLTLVPDVGQEQAVTQVAQKLGCAVANLPGELERNDDAWDFLQAHGHGALAGVLESAAAPADNDLAEAPAQPQAQHPLAQFVRLNRRPQAVRWVVPGLIEEGVVTIAGARGVGKTTVILPLSLAVAGLHAPGYPLAPHPDRWRHVIYVAEQVSQAERILAGVVEHSSMGVSWEQVDERLHLVEARRLDVADVADVGALYRRQFTRVVDGVEILPLVIFDTQAASFAMASENDNSEASRIMATLKQSFAGLPVWLVSHVAKAAIGRSDIPTLTARGAGAFEADAAANLYITTEGEGDQQRRYLSIGKTRAEPQHGTDLAIESACAETTGSNAWGESETVHLRWATVQPMEESRSMLRAKAQEDAQEAAAQAREVELREELLDRTEEAWRLGHPLSRSGLRTKVRGKVSEILLAIDALEAEGWLHQVEVPAAIRANNSKARFMVRLTAEEKDKYRATGVLPTAKTAIPASWRKAEVSPVPANSDDATKTGAKSDKNHS
jgi:RecA-family ATPase